MNQTHHVCQCGYMLDKQFAKPWYFYVYHASLFKTSTIWMLLSTQSLLSDILFSMVSLWGVWITCRFIKTLVNSLCCGSCCAISTKWFSLIENPDHPFYWGWCMPAFDGLWPCFPSSKWKPQLLTSVLPSVN